ncbi:MAG: hypothetical protein AAGF57_10080 [Pseudomonadota bacterium]
MYRRATTLLWTALLLGWGSNAQATLMDAIDALNPGDLYRVMFVGTTPTSVFSTDVEDYNAVAQADGANGSVTAPLGLSWKVVGSTETVDARDNTATVPSNELVTIFNTIGEIVATSYADLWDGRLNAAVKYTPDGDIFAVLDGFISDAEWTGTQPNGTASTQAFGTELVRVGVPEVTNGNWTDISALPPEDTVANLIFRLPIYGISDVATVAAPPIGQVPVPTTFYLFALGLALLRLRRR